MAKTLTHQFIKTGIDAVRSDPGLWGSRTAETFLAAAETNLRSLARKLGIEPGDLEALVANVTEIHPPKVRDIILFGLKCARDPQSLAIAALFALIFTAAAKQLTFW